MTHVVVVWSRLFLISAALLLLVAAAQSPVAEPLVLNRQAELFLHDQAWIESSAGLAMVPPQVRRHPANPLLVIDRPWEETGILNYVCVMHDTEEGLYKMWYQILQTPKPEGTPADPDDVGSPSRCLYAVSKDGIRWEKPALGLVEFRGSKQNNIAFIDPNPKPRGTPVYWVIKDHSELDPAHRYKMMFNMWDHRGRGVATAYSPDGIRWTFPRYANLLGGFDAQNVFFWDDRIGAYAAYLRGRIGGKRTSARATSPDARHWSSPVTVDRNLPADPPDWEPYGPGVFKYTRARNVYVMYAAGWDARTGVFEGNLGLSRDGITWFRFRGQNFLPVDPAAWDRGGVMPIPTETVVDGQTGVYYSASDHGFHDWVGKRGIGLALFPEGGFAGWRADGEGTLTTRLVEASDLRPSLFLHLATEGGEVRAEVLDRSGAALPGFGIAECEPLTRGGTAVEVKWKGSPSLEKAVAQGPFKIRLRVRRATLFGFRVVNAASLKALF